MPDAAHKNELLHAARQFPAAELTVLLPVFNGVPCIAEALESILSQGFTNFELLVIDDGSTDDTLTILQQFAARDARVRVVLRENRGLIATLNQGLALSSTDLIVRTGWSDRRYLWQSILELQYAELQWFFTKLAKKGTCRKAMTS